MVRGLAGGSSATVPCTHSAAPGPTVPAPILTRDTPRITAPGLPFGSRPSCSTTPRVPTGAYLPAIRGTSSSWGGSPSFAVDFAASIEARTSVSEVSIGTTIVGSTTSSSSGSTGNVRFSLI